MWQIGPIWLRRGHCNNTAEWILLITTEFWPASDDDVQSRLQGIKELWGCGTAATQLLQDCLSGQVGSNAPQRHYAMLRIMRTGSLAGNVWPAEREKRIKDTKIHLQKKKKMLQVNQITQHASLPATKRKVGGGMEGCHGSSKCVSRQMHHQGDGGRGCGMVGGRSVGGVKMNEALAQSVVAPPTGSLRFCAAGGQALICQNRDEYLPARTPTHTQRSRQAGIVLTSSLGFKVTRCVWEWGWNKNSWQSLKMRRESMNNKPVFPRKRNEVGFSAIFYLGTALFSALWSSSLNTQHIMRGSCFTFSHWVSQMVDLIKNYYYTFIVFLSKVDNKFIAETRTENDKLQLTYGDILQQNCFQICTFVPS